MTAHHDHAEAAAERRRELEAEIAELERQVAEARARYAAATRLILQAVANGAQLPPNAPDLTAGPYGEPGEYEANERAAWGRPPKGARLS